MNSQEIMKEAVDFIIRSSLFPKDENDLRELLYLAYLKGTLDEGKRQKEVVNFLYRTTKDTENGTKPNKNGN